MEVKVWEGGLQSQEIEAIEKIKQAFSEKPNTTEKNKSSRGGSLQDQLREKTGKDSMFPWKGYAGFRFIDSRGNEGEFDLVIVTHCNIIIVELKDWNNGEVTSNGGNWHKNDRLMGRSPVSVTQKKVYLLQNKLGKYKHKFTNKGYVPHIEFFVVMSGNADFSKLSMDDEKNHVISLTNFNDFQDRNIFNKRFRPHPSSQVLNQDFALFDEIFLGSKTEPKSIVVDGYRAKDLIFEHPRKIYKEFQAISEISKQDEALLRLWNFNNLHGTKANTLNGRFEIISREREVLQFIKHADHDLYKNCLRSLTSLQRDDVTTEYREVYELPPSHMRLNEFIGKYCQLVSENDRINIVKLLIAKFATLHSMKIAHRDIGDHSLWLSPSKEIALSNFISAYHQPSGTVGDYRKELSVDSIMGFDLISTKNNITPFEQDVQALGVVGWHILTAQRLSKKSLGSIQQQLNESGAWYAHVFINAINGDKITNAIDFFEEIKKLEPKNNSVIDFDNSRLEPYRKPISHTRQYREDDDFIIETEEKEVYLSDGYLVKAWLNINISSDSPSLSYKALHFLERIEKIYSISPSYLPKIRDFGIAVKSSSLYLVTDFVEGKHWDEIELNKEQKLVAIIQLVISIEHLHGLGISHGDLHPKNLLVSDFGECVTFIDIPDFNNTEEDLKNHRYSPENIDTCTAFERDNFAVMRMSCELLGMEWGYDSIDYPQISSVVLLELRDILFGFKSLLRFHKTISSLSNEVDAELVAITIRGNFAPSIIYPDNGHLYVKIEKSHKDNSDARVRFIGVGGNFDAIYKIQENSFTIGFPPKQWNSIKKEDADSSQLDLQFPIKIMPGENNDLNAISQRLANNEEFKRAVTLLFKDDESDGLTEQLREAFQKIDDLEVIDGFEVPEISTSKLWKAILKTETESYPYIEVYADPVPAKENSGELIIPYKSDVDVLGGFNKIDEIEAILVDDDKEIALGNVLLKKSLINEVRLEKVRGRAYKLKEGDLVFFRTKQDRASYIKRKVALERLLDRESVIPDIVDYFEPSCKKPAVIYNIDVTNNDLDRYDRDDEHGNEISLNAQQREGFIKLVKNGPLSMLQGPPGTGKTEFIAAFVHFLIEKGVAKQILLVSQSHEAVNTAAERIRKHCSRLGTHLEVVRFSNREGAVSVGLKDVYSNSIISEKRELFKAEFKYRIEMLSDALGLQAEYLSRLVSAELKIFNQIDKYVSLFNTLATKDVDDHDKKEIKKLIAEMDSRLRESLKVDYDLELSAGDDLRKSRELLVSKLDDDFNIRPDESRHAQALAKITREMLNVLETDRVNYDEFLARSRQLVTGTCVGIGQPHIGIQNNQYDWVIIDEAARSIASELAIAMQSGKRILLVGDHQQLPPLYSKPHKQALARKLGIPVKGEELDELLQSDFARAFESSYGHQTGVQLLTQYRMAPEIGNLVSHTFYDEKLKNGDRIIPDIYVNELQVLKKTVTWIDTSLMKERAYHRDDRGSSIYNRHEADVIIKILKSFSKNDNFVCELSKIAKKDEPAIGVICMYSEQKKLIRQKFNEVSWDDGFKELIKIDTVDSYQGKENRIIILSITAYDKEQAPRFLRSPNRINVALSRAMDRLIIVGATDMWRTKNRNLPLGRVVSYMLDKGGENGYIFLDSNKAVEQF